MSSKPLVVVKLGGSLLRNPTTPTRLKQWLRRRSSERRVIIVGGGEAVDRIRTWSTRYGLPERTAHWFSVDCMTANARRVADWLPEFDWTDDPEAVDQDDSEGWVFDARRWMRRESQLERSWSTTSDSIAAELARRWSARRLVLLKSALPSAAQQTLEAYARFGFVDKSFPDAVDRSISLEFVNLNGWDFETMVGFAGGHEPQVAGGNRRPQQL